MLAPGLAQIDWWYCQLELLPAVSQPTCRQQAVSPIKASKMLHTVTVWQDPPLEHIVPWHCRPRPPCGDYLP